VETYTSWLALPVAGCWVTAQGCVCSLCSDLNTAQRLSFSYKMRARGVLYTKTRYTNRRLYLFLPLHCVKTLVFLALLTCFQMHSGSEQSGVEHGAA